MTVTVAVAVLWLWLAVCGCPMGGASGIRADVQHLTKCAFCLGYRASCARKELRKIVLGQKWLFRVDETHFLKPTLGVAR